MCLGRTYCGSWGVGINCSTGGSSRSPTCGGWTGGCPRSPRGTAGCPRGPRGTAACPRGPRETAPPYRGRRDPVAGGVCPINDTHGRVGAVGAGLLGLAPVLLTPHGPVLRPVSFVPYAPCHFCPRNRCPGHLWLLCRPHHLPLQPPAHFSVLPW